MFDSDFHHRRSIRLKNFDYSAEGAYFVTIVTHERQCLFGDVVNDEMQLNEYGLIVAEEWERTKIIRPNVILDAFVVMPNHFHGIVVINNRDDCQESQFREAYPGNGPVRNSIGAIIGQFKSIVTKRMKQLPNAPSVIWQRNYHEHIIRDDEEFKRTREYIVTNPAEWMDDIENPLGERGV